MEKILLVIAGLSIQYNGFSQNESKDTLQLINMNSRITNLIEIREKIRDQSGFSFCFTNQNINKSKKFTIPAKKLPLFELLEHIRINLHASVIIYGDYIHIAAEGKRKFRKPDYQGTVVDENDAGLKGVEIWDIETLAKTTSNRKGRFNLGYSIKDRLLRFSLENYQFREILVSSDQPVIIKLKRLHKDSLEVALVTAHKPGPENRKTETFYSVNPTELSDGYNNNLLSSIQGKVPGMLYSDANGAAGSSGKLQVRGQHSIGLIPGSVNLPANSPFILINGVVWPNANISMSKLSSMAGDPEASGFQSGLSPLNNINSEDIESIQVYVGAEATALLGTRGTHGVISIQTKKGKTGHGKKFSIHASNGVAVTAFKLRFMNTWQYANTRREAILNDSKTVDESSAPELFRWPLSRSTDWYQYLVGSTARISQLYVSTNGEINKHSSFYFGGSMKQETSVLPKHQPTRRASIYVNLNYSGWKNSTVQLSTLLTHSTHQMPAIDPMPYVKLAPNAPYPTDSKGNLVFDENGLPSTNINAQLLNQQFASMFSQFSNLDLRYFPIPTLSLNAKLGLTYNYLREQNDFPIAAHPYDADVTATMKTASTLSKGISNDLHT